MYNLDQTNLSPSDIDDFEFVKANTAEQIRENFHDKPEVIQHPQPHYSPSQDRIGMPHKNDFISEASYRVTLFHEGVHSTGAEKRLGRKEVISTDMAFGDCDYSKEELVAEL